MGVYVYALRSPRHVRTLVVRTPEGLLVRTLNVASMSFAYKEGSRTGDRRHRIGDVCDRMWQDLPKPLYTATTDRETGHAIKVGQEVFFWEKGAPNLVADTPRFGESQRVGQIVEVIRE